MSRNIPQQQLDEWFDSEVTQYLLSLAKLKLDRTFELRASVFFPGEPFKTQEGKAMLIGEESVLGDLVEALDTHDLSEFYEADEESQNESVRHTPVRRPDLN